MTGYHRLAVRAEPEILVSIRRVKIIINFAQIRRIFGVVVIVARKVIHNLGNVPARFFVFEHNGEQNVRHLFIKHAVGRVESNEVYPRHGEHFYLFADNPFVGGIVIAENGFAPEMRRAHGRSRIVGLKGLVVKSVLRDFAYVVNSAVVKVLTEREEEKHSHVLLVVEHPVNRSFILYRRFWS